MSAGDTTLARREWDFLGPRVLIVSPFPPKPDGIGRYSDQLVSVLADRGFFRLGVAGGGGDRVFSLSGWFRPLRILRHARGVDDVLVMYHPTYFHHGAVACRLASYLSLWLASRLRRITFVIHEPDYGLPEEIGRRGRCEFWLLERVRRVLWRGPISLVFHSEWEQRNFAARFPGGRRRIERLVTHGSFFTSRVAVSRREARVELELAPDPVILLMIGFLSPHKRYDHAIEVLEPASIDGTEVHIVGSPISDWPEVRRHVEALRALADRAPYVRLHERFVEDDEFDLWLRAADAVLVPYASASSSGVVARAQLVGTPVITTAAGGIAEQLRPEDARFSTDEELVQAVRRLSVARMQADGGVGGRGG